MGAPKTRPLHERLQQHLRRFPREKRGRFLEAVRIIMGAAPAASSTRPSSVVKARLERVHRAAKELHAAIPDLPIPRNVPPEPAGDRLAALLCSVEAAGGEQEWLRAADEVRRGKRDRMPGAGARARTYQEVVAEWQRCRNERESRWTARCSGLVVDNDPAKRWRDDREQAIYELNEAACDAATAVARLLRELRELQEAGGAALFSIRPRTGRPTADDGKIMREVAAAYRRHLGEIPVTTRGGTFYNIAVEITGQMSPERAVRAAVAALQDERRKSPRAD